jgi:hypothetical protein
MGRRFALFLWGKPALLTTGDIDGLVGNPWKLSLATQAKLATLPPRLRMELYLLVAGNLHAYQFIPRSTALAGSGSGSTAEGFPWASTLSPQAGRQLVANLTSTTLRHFRTEELADLGVYTLSRQAFFPTSQREWRSWKQTLVRDDVLFGSAVALLLASTDNIQASVSGLLVTVPGSAFRYGWFGEVRDLGFHLHPTLRAGVKAKSPDVEVSAGITQLPGSAATGERRALEVVVNNHWIERLATPRGWEVALTAVGRYAVANPFDLAQAPGQTILDLYLRRPGFAGSSFQSLLIRANASTDFRNDPAGFAAIGVEHKRYDLATLLRVGVSSDPGSESRGLSLGVLVAGGAEPRLDQMRSAMFRSAGTVATRLENLAMIKAQMLAIEARLARRALAPRERAEATVELGVWRSYLGSGRRDLRVELARYESDRDGFYGYVGQAHATAYGVEHGPLQARLSEQARVEIRGE